MAESKSWRDLGITGFALLIEALALLFGVSILTLGAATLLWFALRDYRSEQLKKATPGYRLKFGVISGAGLVVVTTVIPIGIKSYLQRPSDGSAQTEERRHLFIELSKERDARLKAYRDDYVTNLNYNAMDYQLRNPNLNPVIRQQAESKRSEFLTATSRTYEAVEAEEQKFAGLVAEIKVNFPDSPAFRGHIATAEKRPQYSVSEPSEPPYPQDNAQYFLDTEGDKINAVLKRECEQPLDTVLADMESVINTSR